MKGDVRTQSASHSIFVYRSRDNVSIIIKENEKGDNEEEIHHEKIKPYTRKWEASTMATITELDLIAKKDSTPGTQHPCEYVTSNMMLLHWVSQLQAILVMCSMNSIIEFCHCTLLPNI